MMSAVVVATAALKGDPPVPCRVFLLHRFAGKT